MIIQNDFPAAQKSSQVGVEEISFVQKLQEFHMELDRVIDTLQTNSDKLANHIVVVEANTGTTLRVTFTPKN